MALSAEMWQHKAYKPREHPARAILAAILIFAAACNGQKAPPQPAQTMAAARPKVAPTATARHVAQQATYSDGPDRPIFLIVAKTNTGDLVSGTSFYLAQPNGRWLITANHVIEDAQPESIVARIGKAWVRLRIVSQDRASDLAALLPSRPIPTAPFNLRDASPHRGEAVSFTGFPIPDVLGASSAVTVQGPVTDDVSTVGGKADFKISAPATGGDSGAPVLDVNNAVVGIVVYATADRQSAYAVEGFNVLKLLRETQP